MEEIGNLHLNRQFFKVMMPGFRTRLTIPPSFCKLLIGVKSEAACITTCKGSWHVKVGKSSDGDLQFESGWDSFVEHHELGIGYFVVFEHKGNLQFNAFVFDASGCLKEYPLFSENAQKRYRTAGMNHNEFVKNVKKESPMEKSSFYNSSGKRAPDGVKCRPVKAKCLLEAELSQYTSGNPFFTSTMKASNGQKRWPYLNIPSEFLKTTKLDQVTSANLRNHSGKMWPVEVRTWDIAAIKRKRTTFYHGWFKFYVDNKLKHGDKCIFELNCSERKS